MQIDIPKSTAPRPVTNKVKSGKGGTVTLIDETRLAEKQTRESLNLIQTQDGIWKTRWGRGYYGVAVGNETDLDAGFEYIEDRGLSTQVKHLVVVGNSGKIYTSDDDAATWTENTDETFTGGTTISALQIDTYLYMTNGVDNMIRFDGTNLTSYSGITKPANVTSTRTGLTAGAYTAYYQVTALNEVGETEGTVETTKLVNKERDSWVSGEYMTVDWDAVSGAIRYQVYYSDTSGYETLIGSTTTNTFEDDGSLVPNPYIVTPLDNTTTAPKFKKIELSGNKIWGTGDPDNPFRVYFSGVGQYIGYFSAFYGGGWVDLEYGGKEIMEGIVNYRSGKGDEIATVLTKTPTGTGSIWQVDLDIATVGDLSFTLPVPAKIVDYIGCTSSQAIVKAGDKVFFPNVNGIFDLGNKEQIYNILVSAEISQAIRPDYRSLVKEKLENMCGYYYDAKIFFSGSASGGANDLVFIYDVERKNWNYYWGFGVKNFLECSDTNDEYHFLYVPTSGNRLVEMSEDITTDFAEGFSTSYLSGLFSFNDRMDSFAKIYQTITEFGNLEGTVTIEAYGVTKWKGRILLASETYSSVGGVIDFTNTLFGDYMFGDDDELSSSYTQSTIKRRLRVDKRVNSIQFRVSSNVRGTKYSILRLQANGRNIAMMPPNSWRNYS